MRGGSGKKPLFGKGQPDRAAPPGLLVKGSNFVPDNRLAESLGFKKTGDVIGALFPLIEIIKGTFGQRRSRRTAMAEANHGAVSLGFLQERQNVAGLLILLQIKRIQRSEPKGIQLEKKRSRMTA